MLPGPRRSLLLALALAAASLFAAPASADEADDHFAKANAAFQAEKYADALPEYLAAYKLKKAYDIAALLGITEVRLEKYRDAAEHMSFALAHWPKTGEEDLRKNTEANLAEVKKAVVTLQIKTTTKGAMIKINGKPIDPATLGADQFFEPGRREITADAPGYMHASRTIAGKPGDFEIVTMTLMPDAPTPRGVGPGLALGGVGLVGIVVGGALIGTAEGKKKETFKLRDEILGATNDPHACSSGTGDAARCKALQDSANATDALGNGGVAAMVFGIVAGIAATGYFVLPQRKSAAAKVAVLPVAGPSTGGFIVSGAF